MIDLRNARHSTHHLFGIQPNRKVQHYSTSKLDELPASLESANLTIWKLKNIFTLFSLYFDFWSVKTPKADDRKELQLVFLLFKSLRNGELVPRVKLQQAAIMLMQLGTSYYLKEMQCFSKSFSSVLTPQFYELLKKMDFTINPFDELIFHTCNPDIYVWTPSNSPPKKMVVVFLTRSNTLNMPRPLAHILLSKLGVGLMYISNRPNMKNEEFLLDHDRDQTAQLIKTITNMLGVEKLFGLGASYGGYKACQLAKRLNFERVLNFSGAIKKDHLNRLSTLNMAPDYELSKVLSVLSMTDETDIKIRESYDQNKFFTKMAGVKSKSHGSFTSSFLEGKLQSYLNWLITGEDKFLI